MPEYKHREIESKWQRIWEDRGTFRMDTDTSKPKFYLLEMLPYPSGDLHMGHMRNYTLGDAVARYHRMNGKNVFHPIGWDAFGLPAENAAIQRGVHPREWTLSNIKRMREQLKTYGFSYNWDAEIATCQPGYYRWNQWFFLQMFKRGLAYRKKGRLNWCPKCATVLANEQVVDGCCWRHEDTPVEQRELEQWYLKVTDYAEELLAELNDLEKTWPERIVTMQRNWIGKSEGAQVRWSVEGSERVIETFTTRVDTIYGVTAIFLAPTSPLVDELIAGGSNRNEIEVRVATLRRQSTHQQITGEVEKEGVFTGRYAIHPLTGEKVPIWVSNLVLMEYGTGAVQAVPAHDQRDFEFCRKYRLPINAVIRPADGPEPHPDTLEEAFTDYGLMVNSGPYDGLTSEEGIVRITTDLNREGKAEAAVQFRIKDWCLSRQRYWGTPIPVLYCEKCGIVPVPESQLPVVLPEKVKFGKGEGSPLRTNPDFIHATCPQCNGKARRETDTMDTFVDSSWYFYRYLCPRDEEKPFDSRIINHFFPIDQYIGGAEHAVLHLIYCRFWTKVMRDLELVDHDEPIRRLFNQGMVYKDGAKMSKSKGNVVAPDEMVEKYGCDTARLFEMFAGPPPKDMEWSDAGVEGCYRFLQRLFRLAGRHADRLRAVEAEKSAPADLNEAERKLLRKTHQTVKRVTDDFEGRWHFNTSIAAVMELVNEAYGLEPLKEAVRASVLKETLETVILLISPFAPHIAEELWNLLGHRVPVVDTPWPGYDAELAREEQFEIVIQINGKVRSRMMVADGLSEAEVAERAKADPKVASHLNGRRIVRTVVVPRKLVNIVVAP